MKSKQVYWAERALAREKESFGRGVEIVKRLLVEYQAAAKSIQEKIAAFYVRYAEKYGLTYDQAVKRLGHSEFKEWKATLGEYVNRIAQETDPRIKKLLTAHLDGLSYNSRISRLEALQGQIDLILNELYRNSIAEMKNGFEGVFTEAYYDKIYDLQSRAGFLNEFARVNTGMIENVISYPWSGAMFSDRLWRNKQALIFNLREITTQGMIHGEGVSVMAKKMSDKMGQSFKAAERLVHTETSYIHAEATARAYKEAGIKEYEFVATLNEACCPVCGSLDGKHFKLEERRPGVNCNPIHPNCHCTTIEYDPDEELYWKESGIEMPKRMTNPEWRQKMGLPPHKKA